MPASYSILKSGQPRRSRKKEAPPAPAPLPRGAGRPPVRRNEIFDELRRLIVQGHFPPGSRLWTLREICRRFDASPATVHSVLQDLTEAGFIYSRGTRGTYVHDHPPFLDRYAVVAVDHGPLEEVYFRAIRQETIRLQQEGWSLDLVELPREPRRDGTVFDLEARVARHLYKGLIFCQAPDHLLGTAILDTPGIHRLCFTGRTGMHPGMSAIAPCRVEDWIDLALQRAAALGRKRVGLFLHSPGEPETSTFPAKAAAQGLQTHRTWIHAVHHEGHEQAGRIAELLFSLPAARRPDILLVADDNLVTTVTLALKDLGLRLPIISHCNFPLLPEVHIPVTWLGYDIRAMIIQAIQTLELPAEKRAPFSLIPPRFQDTALEH